MGWIQLSFSLQDWGALFNILLGLSSVATAIVTSIVLIMQYKLQKKSEIYAKTSVQPIFNIVSKIEDLDGDGKYECESLDIIIIRNGVKQIQCISVETIYELIKSSRRKIGIKVSDYFTTSSCYPNLDGLVYHTKSNKNNRELYVNLYRDVIKRDKRCFLNIYHRIKISYIDLTGAPMTCYYKNREIIDQHEYNKDKDLPQLMMSDISCDVLFQNVER